MVQWLEDINGSPLISNDPHAQRSSHAYNDDVMEGSKVGGRYDNGVWLWYGYGMVMVWVPTLNSNIKMIRSSQTQSTILQ
jgi:hypothetical protein